MATTKLDRARAQVKLVLWLSRVGRGSTAQAARELQTSPRSVRRQLRQLCRYAPVRAVGEGRGRQWILDATEEGALLTHLDRVALMLGRQAVSFLDDTLLSEGLIKAARSDAESKARWARLERKIRQLDEPQPHYSRWREQIDTIVDGLLRERCLDLRYQSRGGARRYPALRPLTLVVYRRALYLLAQDPAKDRLLRLRVDRIESAQTGERFDYPEDWDPDAVLKPWFGITATSHRGPELVLLRFSAQVASYIHEREWHHTAQVTDLPDGGAQLEMRTGGRELVRFVLEWGQHCEVLTPDWLRQEVRQALREALATYERQ